MKPFAIIAFFLSFAVAQPASGDFAYTILDAPLASQEPGRGTIASGISGSNIVGYYQDSALVYHGFLYNNGTYTVLDHPSAATTPGFGTTITGIDGNNIVGYYTAPLVLQSFRLESHWGVAGWLELDL